MPESSEQPTPSRYERHLPKKLRSALKEINPEAAAVISAVTAVSIPNVVPGMITFGFTLNEAAKGIHPDVLAAFGLGAGAFINTARVLIEAKALKKFDYSASPYSTALNFVLKKKLQHMPTEILAAGATNVIDHIPLFLQNPLVYSGLVNQNKTELIVGLFSATAAIGTWNIGWNSLIAAGKAHQAVEALTREPARQYENWETSLRDLEHALVKLDQKLLPKESTTPNLNPAYIDPQS